MNRFYRKPKPETMKKNRELYAKTFESQMEWLKENIVKLQMYKHKFLVEMYSILITGSRKVTPKMADAIARSIIKCKGDPRYNETVRKMEEVRLEPILGKINVVLAMAEGKNDYSVDFINNVEEYVRSNYRITKKQMAGLNKVYKRLTEDLFHKGENDETN